jgi:hypothetical protein
MKSKHDTKPLHESVTGNEPDANRDPISGAPGAHPVGTGVGAAGAGAAGAVAGSFIGGPVGAAVGAAIGGIAGGLAGKAVAESVNPTVEDEYWRENYASRPYYERGSSYDQYAPAYQYGWESYSRYAPSKRRFEDVEPELGRSWDARRGNSTLGWERAKLAVRDAWDRVERALPGDADNDGR